MSDPTSDPAPTGAAVTVRGLAPALKARLRIRAAHNARSMEAEARAILEAALSAPEEDATDLASFARGLFVPLGGVELELPSREPAREPPDLGAQQPATSESTSAERVASGAGASRAKERGRNAAPAGGRRRR